MRLWVWRVVATLALLLGAGTAGRAGEAEDRLARGRYLGESIVACGNCHTPRTAQGEVPGRALSGGVVIEEPGVFRAVAPNITPDPETGIGAWTDAEIAAAIREGRRRDGTIIGPPMPIALYRGISDADVLALVAWLRSVPPVRNVAGRSTYRIPLPQSYGPAVSGVPGPPEGDSPADHVARGAYLAGPLGHCIECHTPMAADGSRDWSRTGAGGSPLHTPAGPVVPRNITPAGIGRWSDSQIMRAMHPGITPDGRRLMPPMAFDYYGRMKLADMLDIVAYLRSLKPVE